MQIVHPPRKDSQHQVEDKERADDDEGDEVEPVPEGAQGIVGLKNKPQFQKSISIKIRIRPPTQTLLIW